MTKTTNEPIICECGHPFGDHNLAGCTGCYHWDQHNGYDCDCEETGVTLQASRLSTLEAAVERMTCALKSIELIATAKCNVCKEKCTHDVFFMDIENIANSALAETAPKVQS